MIYAMSDLHGCYDKYIEMLDKIRFSSEDTMYVLGDVIDRGSDGIKILLDISGRNNVILLKGNHEDTAFRVFRYLLEDNPMFDEERFIELLRCWRQDGGEITLQQFLACSEEERRIILQTIYYAGIYEELIVNGHSYWLSHTVPGREKMENLNGCNTIDFLWGEPEYDRHYFKNTMIITGHTPTGLIDEIYTGRIYKKHNHIAIDCGVVFGKALGCICLDTLEEFYV